MGKRSSPTTNATASSVNCLTGDQRQRLDQLLTDAVWAPLPGPQTEAFECPADVLFYGGAAGGGKSDLLLGLALRSHRRSIIFRREFAQLTALEERASELIGDRGSYQSARHLWQLGLNRSLEFGATQMPGDERKYQGRPHDLKAFDEITHFTEAQFRFLIGWNRASEAGQRCRVVATGNPPTNAEGEWVIRFFAPWLDRQHPNPAEPGELRWFANLGGDEIECADGTRFSFKDETIQPRSRCFIRARVEDNPLLMAAGYKATLQALPEPLRSQLLFGDFGAAQIDDSEQVIPTDWVAAAQARWTPTPPGPMDAIGVDVARGGRDCTVMAARHGTWFAPPILHPGSATPDGPSVAGLIAGVVEGSPAIHIDVIGVGAAVFDAVRLLGLNAVALNGAERSSVRDRTGQLGFANARAEWYWRLREALDPHGVEKLALPPDRELLADLTAPRWKLTLRGIQIEGKDEIRARIGRSPDKGDAVVYAAARAATPALLAFMAGLMPSPTTVGEGGPKQRFGG